MAAADNYHAVQTSVIAGRYEIIQSEIARKVTLKLDKYTGDVYLLVSTNDNNYTWEKMDRIGGFLDTVKEDTINFQIFLGGIALNDSFLINIHTGKTWKLYNDPSDNRLFWGVILEQ
jgi:hypothetical protein